MSTAAANQKRSFLGRMFRPKKRGGLKAEDNRKSLATGSVEAVNKALSGMKADKKKILRDRKAVEDLNKLQEKFHNMISGSHFGGVSKKELKKSFKEMHIDVEPAVFEKIYDLMDVDKDGTIDENEFCVTMCYFLHHGEKSSDKIELAYRLFDTNHDGTISKREFSDMISTVIGNRLDTILAIQKGRDIFFRYLQKELSEELLIFYEEMKQLKEEYGNAGIPIEKAKELFEHYIEVDSEQQVNISDAERESIRNNITSYADDKESTVPFHIFEGAISECKNMLENGALMRFRQKIKQPPYDLFADVAWEELGIGAKDSLSLENFKKWTNMTPGLFDFLDEVSEEVYNSLNKR